MDDIQVFTYEDNTVRTINKAGDIWWTLTDICKVLGIANARNVASRLDDDEKDVHQMDTLGGMQEMTIINESGLYNLILRSEKPEAKLFRRWVTHEVLPAIHKHGLYAVDALLEDPDLAIKAFTALKEERIRRAELETKVEQDRPKVLFADAVSVSNSPMLIGELAKVLKQNGVDTGEKRLYVWMRDNGYLIRRKGTDYNAPTQRSMEIGLFRVKETAITHSDGHVTINRTTLVTGKGQVYFVNRFLGAEDMTGDRRTKK